MWVGLVALAGETPARRRRPPRGVPAHERRLHPFTTPSSARPSSSRAPPGALNHQQSTDRAKRTPGSEYTNARHRKSLAMTGA